MRFRQRPLANLFSDKSSLILRALLKDPYRKWTMLDLKQAGVSDGQLVNVLGLLDAKGWIRRTRDWRNHCVELTHPQALLDEWVRNYRFDWNPTATYFSSDPNIIGKIVPQLRQMKLPFALTMLSGARLVAPYVTQPVEHIYLLMDQKEGEKALFHLEPRLLLPHPHGVGNIHFSIPFYRSAIARELQVLDGIPVVSNLQLYLDLINEPMCGADQAQWLLERLSERGTPLFPFLRPAAPSHSKRRAA